MLVAVLAFFGLATVAVAASQFHQVKPFESDPAKTFLVQAEWLSGIGCPTNAKVEEFVPPAFTTTRTVRYTDPACPTGDSDDRRNQGLLLAKTGPTNNNAAAVAELRNVKGITLTELGYDLRKPGVSQVDPRGSHCGAGAPRFNVATTTGNYFIGCNSPPPVASPGVGYMRLRWGGTLPLLAFGSSGALVPVTGTVKSISIVFDEGYDTGPDNFGLAVLDNIDVNGTLVGRDGGSNDDDDDDDDDDNDD